MQKKEKRMIGCGGLLILAFLVWTGMVLCVDVQPLGQNGTNIGLSTLNLRFHQLTGVHFMIYHITDWLGLVPVAVCMMFGGIGLFQLIKRKSLLKVDRDLIILGIYYVIVILGYLVFEMIPINYRPILIEGRMEVSYPSSTTLLVLCVMPTLIEQMNRRTKSTIIKKVIQWFVVLFSGFMVIGRMISGVHWITDIVGAVFLSGGLFVLYRSAVLIFDKENQDTHSGGSGCGCCATVFSSYFFKQLKENKMKRLLLIATGALTNATTSQQGESIPGIAHALSIENI